MPKKSHTSVSSRSRKKQSTSQLLLYLFIGILLVLAFITFTQGTRETQDVRNFAEEMDVPTPTLTPEDDLFFKAPSGLYNTFLIAPNSLVLIPGTPYQVTVNADVQNIQKSQEIDSRPITITLYINNVPVDETSMYYSLVANHQDGGTMTVTGQFVASATNEFEVVVDERNTLEETNETNNILRKVIAGATPTPTPSLTPTPTPTPSVIPTPVLRCNVVCTYNSHCPTGLFCSNGYCRSPQCKDESNCVCKISPTPRPVTVAPTKKPTLKPTPTVTPQPLASANLTPSLSPVPTDEVTYALVPTVSLEDKTNEVVARRSVLEIILDSLANFFCNLFGAC